MADWLCVCSQCENISVQDLTTALNIYYFIIIRSIQKCSLVFTAGQTWFLKGEIICFSNAFRGNNTHLCKHMRKTNTVGAQCSVLLCTLSQKY